MAFKCPKGRNQEVRDQGIWEAILQDHANQSMPSETDDPKKRIYIIHSQMYGNLWPTLYNFIFAL